MSIDLGVRSRTRLRATAGLALAVVWEFSQPRVAAGQCLAKWDPPQALVSGDGRPVYVESPAAIGLSDGILLLGTPAVRWAKRDAFDPAPTGHTSADTAAYVARLLTNIGFVGFILGKDQKARPVMPAHNAGMREFVVARGDDGKIHVIWSGANADGDSDGTIWYDEWNAGEWGEPMKVFSAQRLDWAPQKPTLLVSRSSGVHIVVRYERPNATGVAYIRRIRGSWRTTENNLSGLPSQVTARLVGDDSIAIAFAGVGAPGVRTTNGQHIYLMRVAVSDTAWKLPKRIQWSGLNGIWRLRMYELPSSQTGQSLALVWGRISPRGSGADGISALLSSDGGNTWKDAETIPIPFGAASIAHAEDSSGEIHIVFTGSHGLPLGSPAEMYHTSLKNGSWSKLVPVPGGPVIGEPSLSAITRDTLLLVWGEGREQRDGNRELLAPLTQYSFFSADCHLRVR